MPGKRPLGSVFQVYLAMRILGVGRGKSFLGRNIGFGKKSDVVFGRENMKAAD